MLRRAFPKLRARELALPLVLAVLAAPRLLAAPRAPLAHEGFSFRAPLAPGKLAALAGEVIAGLPASGLDAQTGLAHSRTNVVGDVKVSGVVRNRGFGVERGTRRSGKDSGENGQGEDSFHGGNWGEGRGCCVNVGEMMGSGWRLAGLLYY